MADATSQAWFDEEAGPLVRPYAVARGRTTGGRSLDLITLVVVTGVRPAAQLQPECVTILDLARRPTSVAELSAHLDLPLAVVKVLVGDLLDRGLVMTRAAMVPDTKVMQAVLEGMRRL